MSGWSNQVVSLIVLEEATTGFSGIFGYSPTPGAGNLIFSVAAAAGDDPYGNTYVQGVAAYVGNFVMSMGEQAGLPGFFIQNQASPAAIPPFLAAGPLTSGSSELSVSSGNGAAGAQEAVMSLLDSVASGFANGQIQANAGVVSLGQSGGFQWNDNLHNFTIPASSGPFIQGESFHTLTNPSGLSGTVRCKLLPWNAVWMDVNVSWTTAAATTFTMGSNLPSAGYYPIANRVFPLVQNGAPTGIASVMPRLFVPTSGPPQIIVPASSAGASSAGCSVIYPNN